MCVYGHFRTQGLIFHSCHSIIKQLWGGGIFLKCHLAENLIALWYKDKKRIKEKYLLSKKSFRIISINKVLSAQFIICEILYLNYKNTFQMLWKWFGHCYSSIFFIFSKMHKPDPLSRREKTWNLAQIK